MIDFPAVRHAFRHPPPPGCPCKSSKTTLKGQVDAEAWETLRRDPSGVFPEPGTGRIAVNAVNHLEDEVMNVFGV